MAIEQYTESITLQSMKCVIGENDFGYVFPQGDVADVDKVERLLKKAGGKPKVCALDDFSLGGFGKALPEFIITFKDDVTTIIVVECKKSVTKHETADRDHPKDYAVDGALYYAKFLKEEYNVIAVAVSGTKRETLRASAFLWSKGQDDYTELRKARDIILEPKNYVDLVKGKKIQREYSLDSIRETAIDMHEYLREIKMTERHKPIFIAGILIALNDDDFAKTYDGNCITVNYNGSVGEAFYQDQPFWASDDVNVLQLKDHLLNENIAMFLITLIKANKYRFSYGRKWTLDKMSESEIPLPIDEKGNPDWSFMEQYIKSLHHKHITSSIDVAEIEIDTSNWREYKLSDLFAISVSKDANLQNSNVGQTPYISSTAENNGVAGYVDEEPSHAGNVLTIARNGSVGATFYQKTPFCASPDDIRILTPKFPLSPYSALFIKTVIELEKFRFAYGRKLGTARLKELVIKLPTTREGALDTNHMEEYVKSLPYSDRI